MRQSSFRQFLQGRFAAGHRALRPGEVFFIVRAYDAHKSGRIRLRRVFRYRYDAGGRDERTVCEERIGLQRMIGCLLLLIHIVPLPEVDKFNFGCGIGTRSVILLRIGDGGLVGLKVHRAVNGRISAQVHQIPVRDRVFHCAGRRYDIGSRLIKRDGDLSAVVRLAQRRTVRQLNSGAGHIDCGRLHRHALEAAQREYNVLVHHSGGRIFIKIGIPVGIVAVVRVDGGGQKVAVPDFIVLYTEGQSLVVDEEQQIGAFRAPEFRNAVGAGSIAALLIIGLMCGDQRFIHGKVAAAVQVHNSNFPLCHGFSAVIFFVADGQKNGDRICDGRIVCECRYRHHSQHHSKRQQQTQPFSLHLFTFFCI